MYPISEPSFISKWWPVLAILGAAVVVVIVVAIVQAITKKNRERAIGPGFSVSAPPKKEETDKKEDEEEEDDEEEENKPKSKTWEEIQKHLDSGKHHAIYDTSDDDNNPTATDFDTLFEHGWELFLIDGNYHHFRRIPRE